MQQSGTSTLLVESGHAAGDPEKESLRRMNFVGILSCCFAIATGCVGSFDRPVYENLPLNGKRAYDLIIRGIRIDHGNGEVTSADVAVSYQVDTHSGPDPILIDMGDLRTFTGLREIDGKGKTLDRSLLELGKKFAWEEIFGVR